MGKYIYQEIELNFDQVFINLFISLKIIRDSLKLIEEGKSYQTTVLYGQLRPLLTEKRNDRKPLLKHASEISKKDLIVYYKPEKESESILDDRLVFSLNFLNISNKRENDNQKEISIFDLLDKKVFAISTKKFTVRDLIQDLSNNLGGSHYSHKLPSHIVIGLMFGDDSLSELQRFIYQFTKVILNLGIYLLRQVVNLTLYMPVYFSRIPNRQAVIIDLKVPNTRNRFTLIGNQYVLSLRIIDYLGNQTTLISEKPIEIQKLTLISLKVELTYDLETFFALYYEQDLVCTKNSWIPQYLINDMKGYDFYFNTSFNQEEQDFEIGIGVISLINKVDGFYDSALTLQKQKHPDLKVLWIEPKDFMYSVFENETIILKSHKMVKEINVRDIPNEN